MSETREFERTSRNYDVTGPDSDGDISVEWDCDINIIWLSKSDIERMLARFTESK